MLRVLPSLNGKKTTEITSGYSVYYRKQNSAYAGVEMSVKRRRSLADCEDFASNLNPVSATFFVAPGDRKTVDQPDPKTSPSPNSNPNPKTSTNEVWRIVKILPRI